MTEDRNTSVSLRQSDQLRGSRRLVMGIGLWIIIGLFGLYDLITEGAGPDSGWVYLVTPLVIIPTILSHTELRSWIGRGGGSYRLLQAAERNNLTFLGGWLYLLGWASLSALLALSIGEYLYDLLTYITPDARPDPLPAMGVVLVYGLALVGGARPAWRLGTTVISTIIVTLVFMALFLVGTSTTPSDRIATLLQSGNRGSFQGIGLLIAGFWSIETVTYLQGGRQIKLGQTLTHLSIGAVVSALVAFSGWISLPPQTAGTLSGLAESVLPGMGRQILLGLGIIGMGIAWHVFALIMLRQFQVIGYDGCLPEWLLRNQNRFKTPVRLILLQMLLTLGAMVLHNREGLAFLAAFAILLLALGINLTDLLLANQPRAAQRTFRLPLWPIIPATGAGIVFLLLFTLPFATLMTGIGWMALGGLVYLLYGRGHMRVSQIGTTVFQDPTRQVMSRFPIVIAVANPATAMNLVHFGAAVARHHQGHLVLVQVLPVPEHESLNSRRAEASANQELIEDLIRQVANMDIAVQGITRLSRNISQGIIDTVTEESASLLIMGWHGKVKTESAQQLGRVLDEVIESASCDITILLGNWPESLHRILIPVAGGANAPGAAEIALALTASQGGRVNLFSVAREDATLSDMNQRRAFLNTIHEKVSDPSRVNSEIRQAETVLAGILVAAKEYDAIILGASDVNILELNIFGNLQFQIARQSDKPLALFRSYNGVTGMVARQAWQGISDLLPTLMVAQQVTLIERMRGAALPNINYFVLITLSAMIATSSRWLFQEREQGRESDPQG